MPGKLLSMGCRLPLVAGVLAGHRLIDSCYLIVIVNDRIMVMRTIAEMTIIMTR